MMGKYVRITDLDDMDFGRCGYVRDEALPLYLIHFCTGNGEPHGWFFENEFEVVNETPPRITTEDAEAEPESDRLFGPAYDARQRAYRARGSMPDRELGPWDRPTVQRAKSTNDGA